MQKKVNQVILETSKIVLDKDKEIKLAMACLLAGGHLLIEDVPGVGKTTLVQTLGKLSGLNTHRIQFTIDLLPADILGGQIYNPKTSEFSFHQGPLFAQLILADELNRASPRTQGALLQAMEENQVSIDGVNHSLPEPFFVIATQNPHQQLGTFPLPESQLDRFLMSLELNYASNETEIKIFQNSDARTKINELSAILNGPELLAIQKTVQQVAVSEIVAQYVSQILQNSRQHKKESLPLSTRAGLGLVKAAKAWAYLDQRQFLRPDDIQQILIPVLAHRLGGNHGCHKGREWATELLETTPVPG